MKVLQKILIIEGQGVSTKVLHSFSYIGDMHGKYLQRKLKYLLNKRVSIKAIIHVLLKFLHVR